MNDYSFNEVSAELELQQKMERRYPILLNYRDDALERAFHLFYAKETRPMIQATFLLSVPVWVVCILMLFFLIPDQAMGLALISMVLVSPFFLLSVYMGKSEKYLLWYQPLALITNIVTALLVLYLCSFLESVVPNIMAIGLMLMLFIGLYGLRLRARYAILSSLVMIVVYEVYLLMQPEVQGPTLLLMSVVLLVLELFACLASYVSESTSRKVFEQRYLISQQRDQISFEHERAEKLLLNILPPSIADRLRQKEEVIADQFDQVSLLFADIVGFTPLSSRLSAYDLVQLLNNLFSRFDDLVTSAGLEKIKTIGDAYMVAGGMPQAMDDHPEAMAALALAMQDALAQFNEEYEEKLELRIGMHIGSAVAGVIGHKKFIYDVWGDAVNIASRMESHGAPGRIHVSDAVYQYLHNTHDFEARGLIEVKGKGAMKTWFLLGSAT